jgi:hypothetical protein
MSCTDLHLHALQLGFRLPLLAIDCLSLLKASRCVLCAQIVSSRPGNAPQCSLMRREASICSDKATSLAAVLSLGSQ